MADKQTDSVLIIGVGTESRRDDAVGLTIAKKLRERLGARARVAEESGEGARLLERFQSASTVIVIDATRCGRRPGTIFRIDAHEGSIPAEFFNYSTHNFSVAEAVETARAIGQMPPRLILYGIEGERFEAGEGLTEPVRQAGNAVVEKIVAEFEPAQEHR